MKFSIEEAKVTQEVVKKLTDNLDGKLFEVKTDVRLNTSFAKIIYADIVVYDVDKKPFAAFEVKGFPKGWTLRVQMDSSFSRTLNMHGVKYYIITDGVEYWVRSADDTEFVLQEFNTLLATIIDGLPALGKEPTSDDILKELAMAATKAKLKQANAILRFVGKGRKRSLFKTDASTGWIEFVNTSSEDAFYTYLLNGKIPLKLCRFTNRHNLYLLLKDGKQNMCSIVCMNDKSEENYADNKVGLRGSHGSALLENNNCFIMSLMPEEKSDDLTMWRLYGDDAKGVCLNYEFNDKHRGRRLTSDFYVAPISYGIDEKSHPELDFIKYVLDININHWHFHFNRWMIWKHFFKSFRFKDEKEVRLLYLSNDKKTEDKKWIENSDSGIVSKMLMFSMIPKNEFPLRLCNVIVGPKAPEPAKIAEQFAFIVSQEWKKYTPIIIRESKITEYR